MKSSAWEQWKVYCTLLHGYDTLLLVPQGTVVVVRVFAVARTTPSPVLSQTPTNIRGSDITPCPPLLAIPWPRMGRNTVLRCVQLGTPWDRRPLFG